MKEMLREFLEEKKYTVVDCGNTVLEEGDDYSEFGILVGRAVANDPGSLGMALCGSGVGMSVSANKVAGVRAGYASDAEHAKMGKRDDDTNVLCLGTKKISADEVKEIALTWIETPFQKEEERFVRRVEVMKAFEKAEAIRTVKNFSKVKIVPAILETNIDAVYRKLSLVEGLADWVQLDIMDGAFVAEKSFDLNEFDKNRYGFFYEAHLMVSDPFSYLDTCERVGIDRVLFHWESMRNVERAKDFCRESVERGMRVGIALNPETAISEIIDLASHIDSILLMGVHPGKSGQDMLPNVMERIREVRSLFPLRVSLEIDGGVTEENFSDCLSVGVERVVMGSAIFGK